ncbi:hypothetical protein SP7_0024 [Escherichia phage vB_EcoP_SP7]|uniref:Uncharacterized protein n=1 Tax=Escherichia phage vB_EcoP_SP7 TaxID=2750854 RepID=A0A7D5FJ17_9CAUD|nr:hypothetical protein SP7_0024 [Escherichia phage vB_EcoP_SP7]
MGFNVIGLSTQSALSYFGLAILRAVDKYPIWMFAPRLT